MSNNSFDFNNSNSTDAQSLCEIPAPLNLTEFFTCFYSLLSPDSFTVLSFFLWISSFILNIVLIVFLSVKSKVTIFDKILIFHALVDFLINILDFSFVIFFTILSYWPFSEAACAYYVSVDNALATIEIFVVLYMSWVRMRCILAPKTYLNELIISHFYKFQIAMWTIVFILWTSTGVYIIEIEEWFDQAYCQIDFGQDWLNLLILISVYLVPLALIGLSVVLIFVILSRKKSKVKGKKIKKNKPELGKSPLKYFLEIRISAQTKLVIITIVFLLQYSPFYVTWLLSLLCDDCVSDVFMTWVNFLAYCPSFVNPVVIMSLSYASKKT